MLASAARLPASVDMYLAMAPSVFRLPSPASIRSARLFDEGAPGFQSHDVGHDQLVGVSLLFRERRSGLNALGGVRNRAIERGPARAQAEGRHHQAGVAEDRLRLIQALAFHAADQPVGIDIDVVERKSGGVAEADAVLVLRLVLGEARRPFPR